MTAERFEDLAALFRTGLARVCWDMEPRQTTAEDAAPLDDLAVWAIPCVYAHPAERGRGIALLQAAVQHAGRCGAPAVEAAAAAWASDGLDTSLHDAGSVRATHHEPEPSLGRLRGGADHTR